MPVPGNVTTSLGFLEILENGHVRQSENSGSASYTGTCLHTYRLLQMAFDLTLKGNQLGGGV